MDEMSHSEIREFLLSKARTGKLATVRKDGRPHVTPIWFDLDGDELVFTTWHTSVKAANLLRTGQASVCVDDETPPFAFAIIEGRVDVDTDPTPEERYAWAARIAGRYMGAERAEEYGRRNGVPGEYIVRLKPDKIIAQKGVAN